MAPFRNFLARRSAAPNSGEPDGINNADGQTSTERPASSPLSFRENAENKPVEYKLSVVDDNGDYLPPSPPEKASFWRRYPGSKASSNHRNLVNENEPFSISRESFDSYRRSFDISARSPVNHSDALPSRTSLDSRFSRISSPALRSGNQPQPMQEEQFEEVELDTSHDEAKPKKKGFLSRLGDFTNDAQSSKSPSSHLGFHLPGRKRGQSNAGSEMNAMQSPPPSAESDSRDS